jgi:serine phosphatase RsbU (regulator of sigma subunit)
LDAFAVRTPDAQFSTVCAALLEPGSGVLRYACAGHPPPLLLRPDGVTSVSKSPLTSCEIDTFITA